MWIFIGYISFSIVLGFFVGASNTPVVGTFLTASLGLAGTIVGAKYLVDASENKEGVRRFLGITITLISVGLISGELLGELHKNGWKLKNELKTYVWSNLQPPQNTNEALDWLVLTEKLMDAGYTFEDVQLLYRLRLDEIDKLKKIQAIEIENNGYNMTKIYQESMPYYNFVDTKVITNNKKRGPASVK